MLFTYSHVEIMYLDWSIVSWLEKLAPRRSSYGGRLLISILRFNSVFATSHIVSSGVAEAGSESN